MSAPGFLLALVLAGGAWSALAMAMDRHYADIHGRGVEPAPPLRMRLRGAAVLGLLASLALNVHMQGWGVGLVAGLGVLTLAALLLVLAVSYWPARLPAIRRALLLGALPLMVWWVSAVTPF
ncbi:MULTISPECIES: DUF3325 domain-containing protein [Herbaspirillum]|jgi:hypothetical protein|uniref:Iron uptake protein n=1 Tax=Herbaspirillum aquaticum TaxID=568783 RepID=A0A225SNB8_9BURK|nr:MULTISPECIES: DUF3325 domain-containing protein [Herbaspirillum]MBW9336630.1 DUF3325 domain-containing protein [Herbaspirillum sp. RU 5E]MRT31926.1 DUF3325 domain-containing protein [Herbaspirillum sp. CAH-3]OWY31925.1 hypothetical protein CEJ45_23760 [Herbaspirillum aquaticum]